MSSTEYVFCKIMWIDGKTYKIDQFGRFDPRQVQEYCVQPLDHIYKGTFKIPAYYGRAVQEAKYRNSIAVIENTPVKLTISGDSAGYNTVSISAHDENTVGQGIYHFHNLLSSIRETISAQQFLAVPVLNEEVRQNFLKFKEKILTLNAEGVDECVFMKDRKLHLSINVFSLVAEVEISAAKQALADCKTEVILPYIEKMLPLKLDVRGIDSMQGNHEKVHVLYAKASIVHENEQFTLQILLDKINEYFYQKGFINVFINNVKIHMTLINTKYRNRKTVSKRRWTKRIPINASEILSKYNDFYFGQSDFNSINLCKISASSHDGFYETISEIKW